MGYSKIEWCDYTWNPITGCLHGCGYCYARKMAARFSGDIRRNLTATADYEAFPSAGGELFALEKPMADETGETIVYPFGFAPTLHRYRLGDIGRLKAGKRIFVGSMADVFGEWVPDEWLDEVMKVCRENPMHHYLFLTKNAERYTQYAIPEGQRNLWFGTSITRNDDLWRLRSLPEGCRTFASFEPLLEEIRFNGHEEAFGRLDWIIIGAETGSHAGKTMPAPGWVMRLAEQAAQGGIPVFMKDSLLPIIGKGEFRQDFPEQLRWLEMGERMKKRIYGVCAECGITRKKSGMVTLMARYRRGEAPKQLGFLCRDCFSAFCREKGFQPFEGTDSAD